MINALAELSGEQTAFAAFLAITVGDGAALFGVIVAAGVIIGVGILQLRRGALTELRDTIATANAEIDLQKSRGDRLEGEVRELKGELEHARAELESLRDLLRAGETLAPYMENIVRDVVGQATARQAEVLRQTSDALDTRLTEHITDALELLVAGVREAKGGEAHGR